MTALQALALLVAVRPASALRGEIVTSVRLRSTRSEASVRRAVSSALRQLGVYSPAPVGPVPTWRSARDGTRGTWATTWGAA